MSSFRKSNPRRDHKERAQPVHRSKYGLLEKHKDYVLRAKDFHFKQDRLKALKDKARNRNDDEFYFAMQNQRTKKGVHISDRNAVFSHDFLQLLKSQDAAYVQNQININANKIRNLREGLSFNDLEAAVLLTDSSFDFFNDLEAATLLDKKSNSVSEPPKQKHTIFVDDSEQLNSFDPSEYFDTPSELLNRKFNRLKKDQIEQAAENIPSKQEMKKLNRLKSKLVSELAMRMERQDQLKKVLREMQIQKELQKKGSKIKVGKDAMGLPVYKWKYDRKR
ncbi:hypothetical protein BB560_000514 [Smittium megazygosporum]|uniref:U3 small nucleolar RNA-associated protein 11 n=1 Tax=Smittium megazygosporum TaxID=133381 RepID=A0A2T9ZK52_9FUNG|nr:hypothetical protein BB560_000514 [Smittium megazygosporum]